MTGQHDRLPHGLGLEDPALERRLTRIESTFRAGVQSPFFATDYINLRRHIARGRKLQGQAMATGAKHLAAAVKCWWKEARTLRELRRLDDHLLKDIGILRAEIPVVAHRLAHAAPSAAKALPEASVASVAPFPSVKAAAPVAPTDADDAHADRAA